MNDFKLNEMHFSALQELGNIGAGNAVTSLATMLGRKIDMKVPNVQVLDFKQISHIIGGPENPVAAVLVNINSENINGMMMFIVELEKSHVLIGALMQRETKELGEIEMSALQEVGNILTGSYLGALSTIFGTTVDMSVPYLSIDMAGSVLSVPAIEFAKVADSALFIESLFDADEGDISGYFILVPDQDSFRFIFGKMGLGI
ncbi:MAG: chemotaxis protein CheC [Defluviitaleaceae bacterium]|nr:chemotaxis protein CheC [Defluviitaleaceae bacterium]